MKLSKQSSNGKGTYDSFYNVTAGGKGLTNHSLNEYKTARSKSGVIQNDSKMNEIGYFDNCNATNNAFFILFKQNV